MSMSRCIQTTITLETKHGDNLAFICLNVVAFKNQCRSPCVVFQQGILRSHNRQCPASAHVGVITHCCTTSKTIPYARGTLTNPLHLTVH